MLLVKNDWAVPLNWRFGGKEEGIIELGTDFAFDEEEAPTEAFEALEESILMFILMFMFMLMLEGFKFWEYNVMLWIVGEKHKQ